MKEKIKRLEQAIELSKRKEPIYKRFYDNKFQLWDE